MANKKKSQRTEENLRNERRFMIGPRLSFAGAEAYKLLRTNIMFSFSDHNSTDGKVIGVTSSVPGEGKSMTMINLAYTFAESRKRVLLIEGDMRLPTMANRLRLRQAPGLSDLMVGLNDIGDAVQHFTTAKEGAEPVTIDIIVAGTIPPNPSELMGSARLDALLGVLRKTYDYIFLDQPPVTAVTDALITAPKTDGTIIVVRNNHASRGALADTMRQLRLVDAHILGFVYNGASDDSRKYYKKGYYKKGYYKKT
jgi:capsular exopolysaccharide synthesis family protein